MRKILTILSAIVAINPLNAVDFKENDSCYKNRYFKFAEQIWKNYKIWEKKYSDFKPLFCGPEYEPEWAQMEYNYTYGRYESYQEMIRYIMSDEIH